MIARASSEARKFYFSTAYNVHFGRGVVIERGAEVTAYDGGCIEIGSDTYIRANTTIIAKGGIIKIGCRGLINAASFISATYSVTIGDDVLIAEHVTIRDADHATQDPEKPFNCQGLEGAPIVLGDSVWLGAKVTVTTGVSIGSRAVVGANAVVTRSLAGGGRYGGVPAQPIRSSQK